MKEMGQTPPASAYKPFKVMGKPFDPDKPGDYVSSFAIRRA
jgi:nitrate/nitrite transport system substrate-binding protein